MSSAVKGVTRESKCVPPDFLFQEPHVSKLDLQARAKLRVSRGMSMQPRWIETDYVQSALKLPDIWLRCLLDGIYRQSLASWDQRVQSERVGCELSKAQGLHGGVLE